MVRGRSLLALGAVGERSLPLTHPCPQHTARRQRNSDNHAQPRTTTSLAKFRSCQIDSVQSHPPPPNFKATCYLPLAFSSLSSPSWYLHAGVPVPSHFATLRYNPFAFRISLRDSIWRLTRGSLSSCKLPFCIVPCGPQPSWPPGVRHISTVRVTHLCFPWHAADSDVHDVLPKPLCLLYQVWLAAGWTLLHSFPVHSKPSHVTPAQKCFP
jgi:hypothetical protein